MIRRQLIGSVRAQNSVWIPGGAKYVILLLYSSFCDRQSKLPFDVDQFPMMDSTARTSFRFTKHTLANGLDVIFHRKTQLPIVAVNLWYHVGSKNEERNQRGFTHLVEHLMFEGSLHYPGDFFKHLQKLGAEINGSTSSDRTNYFVDLPSAHFERAIAMESDRMANLMGALTDAKLRIQKDVVKNEYRQNYANRPYGRVWPLIAEALFPPEHPYSWMTIGAMEDIERASMDDVHSFFGRFYVPSNASVSVAGDLEEDRAFALLERYFEPIAGGARTTVPWVPERVLSQSIPIELYDRVELDRLYLMWPTVPHFHDDDAALLLLGDVLGRGRSSRLYRRLVLEEEIAQDVTAYQSGRELAGSFGLIVTLRPSRSLAEAHSLIDREVAALAARNVDESELRRVQRLRVASFWFALEHIGGFGGVADRLNAYNIYRGDPGLITADVDRFERVTAEEMTAAAVRYLAGRPRVELSVKGAAKRVKVPRLDRTVLPESAIAPPYGAPVPRIIELRGGIPLWVFPRSDLPTVTGAIVIPGGAGGQQPGQGGLAHLAITMLEEGTTSRSAEQIALAAESMGASVSTTCGWGGAYVSFKCLAADYPASLELAADILRNPTFPEAEWGRVRGQALAALKAERDHAEPRAHRGLLLALYPETHPYRYPLAGTEASLERFVRSDLAAFHAQVFLSARPTIIVAGDVDPDTLASELERRLLPWPEPGTAFPELLEVERSTRPRLLLLDRPGAAQAVLRAGYVGLARSSPDFDHVLVLNHVLGGQFTSRLNESLREERGLTYGVRSSFDFRRRPGPFSVSASVQTEKVGEALDQIRIELEAIVGERPPTGLELENARRSLIEGHPRHFESPGALVNRFAGLVIHDLPVDHDAGFADRLAQINADSLLAAATRHIVPGALIALIVADASRVRDQLEKLTWAPLEVITD
jgi:zinc protease